MLELRTQTCAGSSEPLSHYEIMFVDSFNFNRAVSRADPEHFVRGGSERTEMPLKMDMHMKEGTCLKCSVGRKVGLDYNSWYACLPLIRHVGRSSFANFDSRS